jgi:membrane-associated protein
MDIESLIQAAGHIGIIAAIFAESGILIGLLLPGDSLLITAGFLAAGGLLDIRVLIIGCTIAAIVGDAVGYATGKYFGPMVFVKEDSFFFRKAYIEKTAKFFERYGRFTIIAARFTPIVRTLAPIMAGVGGMSYRKFAVYNIIGGLLWATGLLTASYAAGLYIPGLRDYIEYIVVAIIALSILPLVRELIFKKQDAHTEGQN